MQGSNEKAKDHTQGDALSIGERINDFVQKNRKPIFITAGTVVVLLVACIAVLSVMDILHNKAISAVEDFSSRYETLKSTIAEDAATSASADIAMDASTGETSAAGAEADMAQLRAEIERFAAHKSGYAGGRAWAIIAAIHADKKDWAAAETAWAAAAKAAAKTYLGPAALFNAGAAAEEQGKTAEAIEYYSSSLTAAADFPSAPRAQFSIGRLRESQNDTTAAIEAYRAVISGWPYNTVWTNLAHSRIIALEIK